MKYSEETLQSWTAPLSNSEENRAENTIRMIRSAIDSSDRLSNMDIEVFTQGSFANNTNVRSESDVDVCVMLKDTFHTEYPKGKVREDYGFKASSLGYEQYRGMVKNALNAKFKAEHIYDGDKSLKIHENTYHVDADVVPVFQLRNYYYLNSSVPDKFVEGTWFKTRSGKEISNYPKKHIENGVKKNKETNKKYKKTVRIMKHIKNNMVEDGITNGDIITSFLIECLIYNTPNTVLTGYNSWNETVKQTIIYLYNEINNGKHSDWAEVSGILYLFKNRKWTAQDAKKWLNDAWIYLGYNR